MAREPNAGSGHFLDTSVAAVMGSEPGVATNPEDAGSRASVPSG